MFAARGEHTEKAEFIRWWRGRVMNMALLLHQRKGGLADGDAHARMTEALLQMAIRWGGVLLSQPWLSELMCINQETGEVGEPPQHVWDRTAKNMALTPEQAFMYSQLDRWWVSTASAFNRQRKELAGRALQAPTDVCVQAEVVGALEAVQRRYVVSAASVFVLGTTSIMAPEQLAEVWVTCWPYMPMMTAILDAIRRQHEGA
ncbi:hypothetical protein Rsub_11363 [Raphidocelis subcapitata]|uniref:Uncharacterized protein n=1 Tax=Raphidocelis subcapitata TaxID=307507 RepID=A0A2V0PG34_9CHLO|nr:hypothetical protein Rsub_11363 [Raphidocelis subcapitata]|eukprot:GBF98781.1 hypothetical protein Rsub_11363 [Raphidocelis subcapitata]